MTTELRRFLFSRWFFGLLTLVLAFDLVSDIAEHILPEHHVVLNYLSIVFDLVGFVLVMWMFVDLSRKRASHGDDSGRG